MRLGGEPVGRWGLALMTVAGVTGIVLGWHGWTARGAGAVPVAAGVTTPASRSTPGGTASPGPASAPHASPSGSASPASGAGPLLSSEPFASQAFQIWPGSPSPTARQALTGLHISVRKVASGLSVTAGVNGQPPAKPHVYAGGVKVYVVEAALGDDSGNADYNLGDDGLVVTDAQGRIVR